MGRRSRCQRRGDAGLLFDQAIEQGHEVVERCVEAAHLFAQGAHPFVEFVQAFRQVLDLLRQDVDVFVLRVQGLYQESLELGHLLLAPF